MEMPKQQRGEQDGWSRGKVASGTMDSRTRQVDRTYVPDEVRGDEDHAVWVLSRGGENSRKYSNFSPPTHSI